MTMTRRAAGLLGVLAMTTACATSGSNVQASYVSPMKYASYDCESIQYEMASIESRVNTLTGQQNKKARNDRIATGVGVVLFWPALFMLASDDVKNDLSQAKGEYDALQEAARRKRCFEDFDAVR